MSSPSAFGTNIAPAAANVLSTGLLALNPDLQWSEGSFRGFFVLSVSAAKLESSFYALAPGDLRACALVGCEMRRAADGVQRARIRRGS